MIVLALTLAMLPLNSSKPPGGGPDAPATQPSAQQTSSEKTPSSRHAGRTGTIDAQGYIEPVNAFDVQVRPKAFGGELAVLSAATDGAHVHRGDVLLRIDPAPLDRQIAAARNDVSSSKANLERARADASLGAAQDELALNVQTEAARQADDAVQWFETVDGPNILQGVELGLKNAKAGVDDQQDELNELKKMYKGQDLTTDTADIVVKRAVRKLDTAKVYLKMEQERARKTRTFTYPSQRQHVADAAKQARQQLESLKIAQAQTKVLRATALVSARAAADAARRKLRELQTDRPKLTVSAPADGVVFYGQFVNGAFTPVAPDALAPGERIAARQVVMTFYTPGRVRLHLDLPAEKFFQLSPGTSGVVTTEAFPDRKLKGVCEASLPIDFSTAHGPVYHETVSLPDARANLVPGLVATFHAKSPHGSGIAEAGK